MAYCTVLFKCSHRRPKHNLFTEKTTFYCPVNNFPLKKKTMYSILGLCETSGNFSSVAKAIRNLHPHSNYWFFNLMQNNFKLTTEQIYKQRLSAAPPHPATCPGQSETKQQTHLKAHLVSQTAHEAVLLLCAHFPKHSAMWIVSQGWRATPAALASEPQSPQVPHGRGVLIHPRVQCGVPAGWQVSHGNAETQTVSFPASVSSTGSLEAKAEHGDGSGAR